MLQQMDLSFRIKAEVRVVNKTNRDLGDRDIHKIGDALHLPANGLEATILCIGSVTLLLDTLGNVSISVQRVN